MSSFSFFSQPLLYPVQKPINSLILEAGTAKGTKARWEMATQQGLIVSAVRYLNSWGCLWSILLGSILSFNWNKSLPPPLVSSVGPLHVVSPQPHLCLEVCSGKTLYLFQDRLSIPLSCYDCILRCSVLNSSFFECRRPGLYIVQVRSRASVLMLFFLGWKYWHPQLYQALPFWWFCCVVLFGHTGLTENNLSSWWSFCCCSQSIWPCILHC